MTDLNWLARHRRDQQGFLLGPDIEASGGRCYAVGDHVVALTPNHRARLVTSERLRVVDAQPGLLTGRRSSVEVELREDTVALLARLDQMDLSGPEVALPEVL